MMELDEETVQAIRKGLIPGISGIWFAPVPLGKTQGRSREISRGSNGRRRTPSLSTLIRQAEKGGMHVSGVVVEDGKVELKFGEPKSDGGNDELSVWKRKHDANFSQGY
jgi:hypothetical protein